MLGDSIPCMDGVSRFLHVHFISGAGHLVERDAGQETTRGLRCAAGQLRPRVRSSISHLLQLTTFARHRRRAPVRQLLGGAIASQSRCDPSI